MAWVLFLILLLEGLGIYYGHEIAYYSLIVLPFFLIFSAKKIEVPRGLLAFGIVVISLIFLSTFFSINIGKSASIIFLYPSLIFLSILAFNNKPKFEAGFKVVIRYGTVIFVFLSYLNLVLDSVNFFGINPLAGFGMIYDRASFHNNIGDFLLIFLVLGVYNIIHKKIEKNDLTLMVASLPVFILSNSRTAYISLFAVFVFIVFSRYRKITAKSLWMVLFVVTACLALYMGLNRLNYLKKDMFGHRLSFYIPAVRAIIDYPLTGVGLGNYDRVSTRYNDMIFYWSKSVHSLFLELGAEMGLGALLAFICFAVFILVKARRNDLFFIFLVLLLDFQFYGSYQVYFLLAIFFLIAGLIYPDSKNTLKVERRVAIAVAFVPLLYVQLLFIGSLFKHFNQYKLALLFPFDKHIYPALIEKDYENKKNYVKIYDRIFYSDLEVNEYLAGMSLAENDKSKALDYLKRSFVWSPFEGDVKVRLGRIYPLIKSLEGRVEAVNFIGSYLSRVNGMYSDTEIGRDAKTKIKFFLLENDLDYLQR